MKNITKTIAALVVGLVLSSNVNAQKVAHISVDSLLSMMPETKKAQDIAQEYLKQLEKEISAMKMELDTKYQDYMTNKGTYSDLVAQNKEADLQSLNQRIEEFRGQAQQDYQAKYTALSKPIYEKAKKAIEAVAKENSYKYVLDTSTGIVVYSEPSDDILMIVKKKLDTMPEAVLPGSNNGGTAPKNNTPPNKSPGTGTKPTGTGK
jgi:outer membrane protein